MRVVATASDDEPALRVPRARVVAEQEAVIGVHEDEAARHVAERARVEHGLSALAFRERDVLVDPVQREAEKHRPRSEARGARAHEGEGEERVLERENVREQARAGAGIARGIVEGNVGEDDESGSEREREHVRLVAEANRRPRNEQGERDEVRDVDRVERESLDGDPGRFERAETVREVLFDEIAVLEAAPDARAEPVAKAAGRAVGESVVAELRRAEPRARGGVRVAREENEAGDHAGDDEGYERAMAAEQKEQEESGGRPRDGPRRNEPSGGEPGEDDETPRPASGAPDRDREEQRGQTVRHRVGGVIAKRRAERGDDGGRACDALVAEKGARRRVRGDDERAREQRTDDERRADEKPGGEEQRVARRKDHAEPSVRCR